MGAFFVAGQVTEYTELVNEGTTISASSFGTAFYLTTGFHALHVSGGLLAFLLVLGRIYYTRRFTEEQATTAIVVSYYWHFVDVVWVGLFSAIYILPLL
jgi:cytochrome c oxidase subunit 3